MQKENAKDAQEDDAHVFEVCIFVLFNSITLQNSCEVLHSRPVMVELRCWIEIFFQIEFLLETESHWRLECTCNLKVTCSKEDLVLRLSQLDSWIPLPWILPNHCSVDNVENWFCARLANSA